MNVTAHQEKKENEETKKGKRGAGEKKKKKQAADFNFANFVHPALRGSSKRSFNGVAAANSF